MKKLLAILFSAVYFCACASVPPFYINQGMKAKERGFSDRLPNLEAIYENEGELKNFSTKDSFVQVNTPRANKFYREVEKNLIDITTDKKGYIVLKPTITATDANCDTINKDDVQHALLAIYTLGILALLDIPKTKIKAFCELEIRILNNDGKLIKKYSSEESAELVSSPQHSCNVKSNCCDRVTWEAYENALTDILEQIYNDRAFLIQELNK